MKEWQEQELMNRLRLKGRLDLSEAISFLGVSESTARRIFTQLEDSGKVIRVHGGIQPITQNLTEYSFELGKQHNMEEKKAIAAEAVKLLTDGDVIFCDSGTTVLCFCMEIARMILRNPIKLQVYTNSLVALEILSPVLQVTLTGGVYRPARKDFCGYMAEQSLSRVFLTKCFLGSDGCDMRGYFTTTDFSTARLCEIAIKNSGTTAILCDSEKFMTHATVGFAPFSSVDRVVTDCYISEQSKNALTERGLKISIADIDRRNK